MAAADPRRAAGKRSSARAQRSTPTPPAPARACAYTVLRRVFEQGAYADHALQAQAQGLDTRDRALAMRLAYGAVQRRGTLDHLIEVLAERPPRRLDPPVLAALRLGLYELLYLQGAPGYAVVAGAVELAKGNARGGDGLVNAVLRRATREGTGLLNDLREDTPAQAAVKHSHPGWIARLWWEQLGAKQACALMAYDNEPGELALRANTLVTDASTLARELATDDRGDERANGDEQADGPQGNWPGVRTHADPNIPEALVLEDPFDVHGSKLWQEGAFIAQSRAAMLVARVLAPETGQSVLDLCAAPGGKSTHLAALMNGTGLVVAVERDRRRAGALLRTAQRLHAHNVRVELADATERRPADERFDRVLVDPPCSGLGTLQARPDLRWRVTPERVREMALVQASILEAGAQAVRPGGVLVYSTCTISPTENERQIAAFLDAHTDFSRDDLAVEFPAFRMSPPTSSSVPRPSRQDSTSTAGFLLTLPPRDRTAGFFIARLRRG